jgi:Arc/MetJ-type ribon-helix-helix transcriptional regulator
VAAATATTITVALPSELAAFVNNKVDQGLYVDGAEVVRDALRRMRCDPCVGANKSGGLTLSAQALSAASSMSGGRADDRPSAVQDMADDGTELDLRLRMSMERRQAASEVLSNLMKKMNEVAYAIVQNLK